jgi:flagellar biogenesis protein FliO
VFQLLKKNGQAPGYDFKGLSGLSVIFSRLIPSLGRRVSAGALELVGTLPLTAQSSLALVRLHDETLLLGITAQNVTLLTRRRETEVGSKFVSTSNGGLMQEELPPLDELPA